MMIHLDEEKRSIRAKLLPEDYQGALQYDVNVLFVVFGF